MKEISIKIEHLDEYHYPIGHELFGKYKATVYDLSIEGSSYDLSSFEIESHIFNTLEQAEEFKRNYQTN